MASGHNGHKPKVAEKSGLPKALIFDLDGTLYRQSPVRRAMLIKMIGSHLVRPRIGMETFRVISAYRHAQETLRERGGAHPDLGKAQIDEAAARSGKPVARVEELVHTWMEVAPLAVLRPAVRPGVAELLTWARDAGMSIGVASDYPPVDKLVAMDVYDLFDIAVAAQDAEVGAFKPDPRLLLETCRQLTIDPQDAMYVGDRAEVDGVAAKLAGMQFALIGKIDGPLEYGEVYPSFLALHSKLRSLAVESDPTNDVTRNRFTKV